MDWFEIFKAGDYPQGRFTRADLEQIAGGYDPALHEAPIVIGHPKNDDPAFGWIEALKTDSGRLLAKPRQVVPEFARLIRDGLYKKVSVRLSKAIKDGQWYLKHVGFLGAQAPQVTGLLPVQFQDDGSDATFEIDFAEENTMTIEELTAQLAAAQQQITQLQAREVSFATTEAELAQTRATVAGLNRTIQRQGIEQFIEGLIAPGQLAPAFKDMGIVDFMLSLDEQIEIEFAASDGTQQKQQQIAWFRAFLEKLPAMVDFTEVATDGQDRASQVGKEVALGYKIAGKVPPGA